MTSPAAADSLKAAFHGVVVSAFRGDTRIVVPVASLHDVLKTLKEKHGFDLLVDITCVDYLNYRGAKDRFGLVYLLASTETSERITIRCFVNDPECHGKGDRHLLCEAPEGPFRQKEPVTFSATVPSVVGLWEGANWLEREVWDMFGIRFTGHADLRRILLPEEFTAHPLRKDYPLQGRGERHNFPVITRAEG
jgi:NADH-quinone oxidoreductase subunit C